MGTRTISETGLRLHGQQWLISNMAELPDNGHYEALAAADSIMASLGYYRKGKQPLRKLENCPENSQKI